MEDIDTMAYTEDDELTIVVALKPLIRKAVYERCDELVNNLESLKDEIEEIQGQIRKIQGESE